MCGKIPGGIFGILLKDSVVEFQEELMEESLEEFRKKNLGEPAQENLESLMNARRIDKRISGAIFGSFFWEISAKMSEESLPQFKEYGEENVKRTL